MSDNLIVALAALVLEASIGYPTVILRAIGHPVIWLGRLIGALERRWNSPRFSDLSRRLLGIACIFLAIGAAAAAGFTSTHILVQVAYGWILIVAIATSGLAQHSLYEHAQAVEAALIAGDLEAARAAVGRFVGRDTQHMSESEVTSAAIESLAESFNDGVVAPVFWLSVGGLPGLLGYKAINTADSLIGHREVRWRIFGWAAARIDDAANFIPARAAGLLITLAAGRGLQVMMRDAMKHASPNSGWPEAAIAGGLSIQLGGPVCYDGVELQQAHLGDGARPQREHLTHALSIYRRACALLWLNVAIAAYLAEIL